jgi:hypothetical protein
LAFTLLLRPFRSMRPLPLPFAFPRGRPRLFVGPYPRAASCVSSSARLAERDCSCRPCI